MSELKNLDNCLEVLVSNMYDLHNICCEKLKLFYGDEEIRLPINIKKVAECLGVQIENDALNIGAVRRVDRNIARLTYENKNGKVGYKIIIDQSENGSSRLSNLEKYAVAYELGKLIVDEGREHKIEEINRLNMLSNPYSLPRLSAKIENFEYEMCAIFLLLPMEQFLLEFQNYLKKNDHPILMDEWIMHLSRVTEIPNYQLVNGYQYIKFCAYQYYVKKLSGDSITGLDFRELYKN